MRQAIEFYFFYENKSVITTYTMENTGACVCTGAYLGEERTLLMRQSPPRSVCICAAICRCCATRCLIASSGDEGAYLGDESESSDASSPSSLSSSSEESESVSVSRLGDEGGYMGDEGAYLGDEGAYLGGWPRPGLRLRPRGCEGIVSLRAQPPEWVRAVCLVMLSVCDASTDRFCAVLFCGSRDVSWMFAGGVYQSNDRRVTLNK